MMYPHLIRLRGPWDSNSGRRVTMPCRWSDVGTGDRACFVRRFGYPGRIDDFERVWLVGAGLLGTVMLRLNGEPLGAAGPGAFEYDVTRRLSVRNAVEIELPRGRDDERPWEEIALEVRCTAYLHGVHVVEGEVRGEVRGTWTGPLELYVMHDGAQAGYRVVPPGEGAVPFSLPLDGDGAIRVDLVNVSAIWHRVEITAVEN